MDYLALMLEPGDHVDASLAEEMKRHMADTFPESVEKGVDVGEVEPVLIGPDIHGWALRLSHNGWLSESDRARLEEDASQLERSIRSFPSDAQPYYERVLRIARLTLAQC